MYFNVRENRKGQSRMDNLTILATLGTQDTGRRQTKQNTTQKTKELSNQDPTPNLG
jgi:hypothetical protein